ncbi:MAG: winged helix-turn-helix domain-containing protein [Terriglobales bacterium]
MKPCQLDHLKREVATGRFKTAAQACQWVEKTFGRRFSRSGMRKLLHRLDCSFHQVSGFLFKADPDKQQEFLKDYQQDQKSVSAEGGRRYFLDGVHPLYGLEVLFGCWLLVGQRFEVGGGGGRKRLNILGAFCPDDHEYVDRRYTDTNLNAQSPIELFALLMAKHPETKRFRIYLDNARYHHAVVLKEWIARCSRHAGYTST